MYFFAFLANVDPYLTELRDNVLKKILASEHFGAKQED